MKIARSILIITATTFLTSCALIEKYSYKPAELSSLEKAPKLDMKTFFNGDIEVFAITQDNNGKIIGSYTAKMNGKWDENKGVIQQNFVYDSGKKDSRTWLITSDTDGTFTAVGHDVATPVKGKQVGNAMQMVYTLLVKGSEGKKLSVDHEDVMYLVDDRSAIGTALIRKEGSASSKSIISYKKLGKTE